VLIGYDAGTAITTTGANGTVAVGKEAAYQLQSGDGNTAIGLAALYSEDDGDFNTAVGEYALLSQSGTTGEVGNTAVGYNAGEFVTTGTESTFIGSKAGQGIIGTKLTGNLNTCIGETSGTLLQGAAAGNTLVGARAGDAMTTGIGNTIMGQSTAGTLTTGNYNTIIGWGADVDAASNNYHVRLGHKGGVKFATAEVTLDNSYTGTPAAGDAAHTNALFTIPAFSHINRIYATVVTLSANASAEFTIEASTSLTVASGSGTGGYELLGASPGTGCTVRSQATQDGNSDIVANVSGSGGVVGQTWVSYIDAATTDSAGWVDGSDVGIYICHSKANTASDGGADAVIQLTVEYNGIT